MKLKGYLMNTAGLLLSIQGEVKLSLLKKLSNEYIQILGATEDDIKSAMFFTCNEFNIVVD